ncbi:MAG: glycerol kinase GlpK [Candidatus Kariarchaeaceae archaeon]|jgi:glycerol kinase
MSYILSIDQGTSSTRSIIFDSAANMVAVSQKEHRQIYPQPSWVEHDPNEIKQNVIDTMREALEKANLNWSDIRAIGITNQRETVVAWDKKTGDPLYNAIVWQCRRTTPSISWLEADGHKDTFLEKTGLVLDAYFSGTKIKWLLENVEEVRACEDLAVGTIDSWVIYFLTGSHTTDASNASRTLLYDIRSGEWSSELCQILGVDPKILPTVISHGSTPFGVFEIESHQIPITGVLGDQQAALFGQTAFDKGELKTTYGTGNFTLMNIGTELSYSKNGLLTTVAWQIGNQITYALEGSVFVTGAAIGWLRDGLGILQDYSEIDELLSQSEDADGVVFVPAFVGLGAPHWDSSARGALLGITGGTSKSNILHATLDSIALQTMDLLSTLEQDTGLKIVSMKVDGGITQSQPLMQKQADFAQISIKIPKITETTALGAALMAGLGVLWPDLDALRSLNPDTSIFHPRELENREEKVVEWKKAVSKSKNWID